MEIATLKKPYSPPTLKQLTLEQIKKLISERKNWTEEKVAEFLKSFQSQSRENKRKQDDRDRHQ